jgi:hypothetical protein
MLRINIVIICTAVVFIMFFGRILNLSAITLQIPAVSIFLIVDLETVFSAKLADITMTLELTELHLPRLNDLLAIAMKEKAKCRFYIFMYYQLKWRAGSGPVEGGRFFLGDKNP